MSFALGLNASVPAANPNSGLKRAANVPFATPDRTPSAAAMTASPVDGSFYEEFYPAASDDSISPALPPKLGILHKLTGLFKKAVKFRL